MTQTLIQSEQRSGEGSFADAATGLLQSKPDAYVDGEYCSRRLRQELEFAHNAKSACARQIHLELARIYGDRLRGETTS